MLKDANGNELRIGVMYQKGTRKRLFLGRELYYVYYKNARSIVGEIYDRAEKWFAKAVPMEDKS